MKATQFEFRFRVAIIFALYFVGFYAPWERFGANANPNPARLWSWIAIEAARSKLLSVGTSYLAVTRRCRSVGDRRRTASRMGNGLSRPFCDAEPSFAGRSSDVVWPLPASPESAVRWHVADLRGHRRVDACLGRSRFHGRDAGLDAASGSRGRGLSVERTRRSLRGISPSGSCDSSCHAGKNRLLESKAQMAARHSRRMLSSCDRSLLRRACLELRRRVINPMRHRLLRRLTHSPRAHQHPLNAQYLRWSAVVAQYSPSPPCARFSKRVHFDI